MQDIITVHDSRRRRIRVHHVDVVTREVVCFKRLRTRYIVRLEGARSAEPPMNSGSIAPNASSAFWELYVMRCLLRGLAEDQRWLPMLSLPIQQEESPFTRRLDSGCQLRGMLLRRQVSHSRCFMAPASFIPLWNKAPTELQKDRCSQRLVYLQDVLRFSSTPNGAPWQSCVPALFECKADYCFLVQIRVGRSALAASIAALIASASWPSAAGITCQP